MLLSQIIRKAYVDAERDVPEHRLVDMQLAILREDWTSLKWIAGPFIGQQLKNTVTEWINELTPRSTKR